MADAQGPKPEDRDERIWQASLRRETQKQIAPQYGMTSSEVGSIIRRKRHQRDERIWQAACRGFTAGLLAVDFHLTEKQVSSIIRKKVTSTRLNEMRTAEAIREMRLTVLQRALPGLTAKVVAAADEQFDGQKFDVGIGNFWLNLLAREAQYTGADQTNVTVSGDSENPLQGNGIDAGVAVQKLLQVVLVALEPFPEATEAVQLAVIGQHDTDGT